MIVIYINVMSNTYRLFNSYNRWRAKERNCTQRLPVTCLRWAWKAATYLVWPFKSVSLVSLHPRCVLLPHIIYCLAVCTVYKTEQQESWMSCAPKKGNERERESVTSQFPYVDDWIAVPLPLIEVSFDSWNAATREKWGRDCFSL